MKTIKYFVLSLVAGLGMASCANEYEYQPAPQDADADRAIVSFPEATKSVQADPNGATSEVVTILRANTENECKVVFDVLENTDDAITFTQPVFAAGDSATTFTVDYSKCEIGKSYTLKLQVTNPELVSQYDNGTTYTFSVIRIKWNPAGFYYDAAGNKVEGEVMYTEDFLTTFFSVSNKTYPVELEERDDMPGMYRLKNPYGARYPYNEPGDYDPDNDYYLVIDATDPEKVYIPSLTNLGFNWGYGDFYAWSLAGYYLSRGNAATAEAYYGKIENGAITFPEKALMIAMEEYNDFGLYQANSKGAFSVVLNPDEVIPPLYEANIETDFDYDEELTSDYESAFLKSKHQTTLYRGTCVVTTDSCDKRFAEQYGTLYILEAPYAEGNDFKFLVKKGKVSVPKGYESQATGLVALNQDVYAVINGGTYDEETKTLNLNISFVDKTGSIEYGIANEVMKMEKWNDLGKGIMQDDIIIPLYGMEPVAYYVQFEEKDSEPGIIRVVNPFGPDNYPYYNALIGAGCTMPEEGASFIINCVDPECAYVERQSLNMDLGDGEIEFISLAGDFLEQGATLAWIKEKGYNGKYNKTTGMITFQTVTSSSGRDFQGYLYEAGELAYYAGMNGGIAFKVPTGAAARMETLKATPSVSNLKKHETRTKIAKPFISGAKKTASKYTVRKSGKAPKAQLSPKRMKKMDASAAIR